MNPKPGDPSPDIGAPTDVAPLGRDPAAKPPHERTAGEEPLAVDWEAIAATAEFQALLRNKAAFIIPATVFFILYYFALPVSVGYFPDLMKTRIIGQVNLAYLFALSQFFMAWIIAGLYVRAAGRFDRSAEAILHDRRKGKTE